MRSRKWGEARRWIDLKDFEMRMKKAAEEIRARGWRPTIPALAEVSGLNDKRIRSRLNYHPDFKIELGVVPALTTGRYAAIERRQ